MNSIHPNLIFLKLGGSLITDKTQPMTPRLDVLHRAFQEIAAARQENPELRILLGHGSGSFGHSVGKKFQTRTGVQGEEAWQGFYEVFTAARALNQIVYTTGKENGLRLFPVSLAANTTVADRKVIQWNIDPIIEALTRIFIPLVYGDVAFDTQLGGTILSTEEIFDFLSDHLLPEKILLAGIEPGIWTDFPQNTTLLSEIRLTTWQNANANLQAASAVDVTGGMKSKVESMLEIIRRQPNCEIQIFSGTEPGSIKNALLGKQIGTSIRY